MLVLSAALGSLAGAAGKRILKGRAAPAPSRRASGPRCLHALGHLLLEALTPGGPPLAATAAGAQLARLRLCLVIKVSLASSRASCPPGAPRPPRPARGGWLPLRPPAPPAPPASFAATGRPTPLASALGSLAPAFGAAPPLPLRPSSASRLKGPGRWSQPASHRPRRERRA